MASAPATTSALARTSALATTSAATTSGSARCGRLGNGSRAGWRNILGHGVRNLIKVEWQVQPPTLISMPIVCAMRLTVKHHHLYARDSCTHLEAIDLHICAGSVAQ